MRKVGICLILLLFTSVVMYGRDTTAVKKIGVSPEVLKKIGKAKDRLVIDFCFMNAVVKKDNGITVPNDFKVSGFSRGINLYFMYDVILSKKVPYFSLAPGIGVGSENFYFKDYKLTWHYDSITRFVPLGDSISSKKSKLNMTYIDIPIEFRYRSKPSNKTGWSWKLAVGFKFGFLVGSKWKYKGEDPNKGTNGEQVSIKDIKVANMSKFRYGPYIRGGYGMFNLFAYYSLSNTFVTNKGPKMNPIVFGLSINGL